MCLLKVKIMQRPSRIFDILDSQVIENPIEKALSYKYNGNTWTHFSTKDVKENVNLYATAFFSYNLQKGERIALISNNRPEWVFCDGGMMQAGLINVPIYPTSSKNDFEFILNNSEARIIFVSDQTIFDKINSILPNLPNVLDIFSFEKISNCKHISEFLSKANLEKMEEVEKVKKEIEINDLATIIYTSGTTGNPKGVMLSHRNIMSQIENLTEIPLTKNMVVLSFLPMCHIFERAVTYLYISRSCQIFYAESLEKLKDNIAEVKPKFFTCVPRLLEKIYEGLIAKGQEFTGFKKMLYYWAVNVARNYDGQSKGLSFRIANKLIFSKWREALGGNIESIVTGAAALQPRLGFFFEAIGIKIREGYGLTETSPVISYNRIQKPGKYGTVGELLDNTLVRFDHRDGMNEGEGEILVKGEQVMMGYFKNNDATAEVIKDGWFYTGDIGKMVEGKYLKITDRAKELFKTSGGKYVAPQVIENKVKESKYIEQIAVIGNDKKFVSALIFPSKVNFINWSKIKGIEIDFNNPNWVENEWINKKMQKVLDAFNEDFSQIEKIKKFKLLPNEWTVDGGELTPTLKVKRKFIDSKYHQEIESLYI